MRNIGKRDDVQLRDHQLKVLAGIFAKAKDEKEVLSVLNTILTRSEKEAIAQRTSIIKKIQSGKSYWEIEIELGTTPSTISKSVEIYLKNGHENTVFNTVLARYKEPKFEHKITAKFSNKNSSNLRIGLRSLQRQDAHLKKQIEKHKKESANSQLA